MVLPDRHPLHREIEYFLGFLQVLLQRLSYCRHIIGKNSQNNHNKQLDVRGKFLMEY